MGIVFTHGVWMGGRVMGKAGPGCISKVVRCKMLVLGSYIGREV